MPSTGTYTSMAGSVNNDREFNQSGRNEHSTGSGDSTSLCTHVLPNRIDYE